MQHWNENNFSCCKLISLFRITSVALFHNMMFGFRFNDQLGPFVNNRRITYSYIIITIVIATLSSIRNSVKLLWNQPLKLNAAAAATTTFPWTITMLFENISCSDGLRFQHCWMTLSCNCCGLIKCWWSNTAKRSAFR